MLAGIDAVGGAVNQRDLHIDDGKTDRAFVHRILHTRLDRGNPLSRDRPAGDFIDKLKAAAARQRAHLDHAIAELAVPTGLLFMAAALFGALADAFLIRRRGRRVRHIHAKACFQPLQDLTQMRFALALQQDFMRHRIMQHA